jgi:HEPN domain-containing protein
MNIDDVKEWFRIADNDFDSANLLNASIRRHFEIICYHCSQAVEKYLKGYLIYNDIMPQKTHNLLLLNSICKGIDSDFENIIVECGFLNRFTNEIRYPSQYVTDETLTNLAIAAVEKIRNFGPILDLKEVIANHDKN